MRGKCAAGGVRGVLMPSEWTGPIKKLRKLERSLRAHIPCRTKSSQGKCRSKARGRNFIFLDISVVEALACARDARSQQIAIALVVLVVLVLFVVLDIAVTIAAGLQWSQSRRPG